MDSAIISSLSEWIREQHEGVLSTHSLRHPGYPFGSILPYFISSSNHISLYMSDLAEHTKNTQVNNRVAITISEPLSPTAPGDEARLTCVGELRLSEQQALRRQEYQLHFPNNDTVLSLPGFNFYDIHLIEIRVIAGFGNIRWLKPQSLGLN